MSSVLTEKTYGLVASPLNNKLIVDLKAKGAEVLIFPAIKTERIALSETEADLIVNLNDFDWLIFADIFAADCFIEYLSEFSMIDLYDLDELTICALGEAVADRLRFVQVHADLIPAKITDEIIFSTIAQYAGEEIAEKRFLIVRERSRTFGFVEMLAGKNAAVSELPIYFARFENEPELTKHKALLNGGAIDEFIFSSAEDIAALKLLYAENDLGNILNDIKAFATSEIAFQTLQENGLRPLYFHNK